MNERALIFELLQAIDMYSHAIQQGDFEDAYSIFEYIVHLRKQLTIEIMKGGVYH